MSRDKMDASGTDGPVVGSAGHTPSPQPSLSPDDRKLLVGTLGVLLAVFALVSSNVAANHSPKPHGLPIGIVGTPAVAGVARAELAGVAPGAFEVHAYRSLTSARTAVLHRSVYGAVPARPRAGPTGGQRSQSPRRRVAAENFLRGAQ